jgi:3D (Asp-Asp-Asp) domain-containing protein
VPLRRSGIAGLLLILCACAPRARVIAAPVEPSAAAEPHPSAEMAFVATAYCQDGTTASGAETARGIVAADPGVLPIGTRVRVSGLKRGHDGIYRVMDTGKRVRGHHIDLFVASCAEAKRFGRQSVHVVIMR